MDTVKLSKTSKLDGIKSWSLEAVETCPGAVMSIGELVDACKGCYARSGNYRYPNVKAPRQFNKEDWKRGNWADDMVRALQKEKYFRWFDSGDLYDIRLARKVLEIIKRTPSTRHWLPTRMEKFEKFKPVLDEMRKLENASVRFSSDSVTGEYIDGVHGSVIIPAADQAAPSMFVCRAYERAGKCNGCRACFDKSIPIIAYPAHGRTMQKIIKLKLAN